MKYEIKDRFDDSLIFSVEANSWRIAVELAIKAKTNLSFANLRSAKTDKTYYQISCIGSRKGTTTYCIEDEKIWCGCWSGTMEEFTARVKGTHKNNAQYLAEYKAAIKFFKAMTKIAKGRK